MDSSLAELCLDLLVTCRKAFHMFCYTFPSIAVELYQSNAPRTPAPEEFLWGQRENGT